MRICFDLDGVICQLRRPGETYEQLVPKSGAVERLNSLRAAGHTIIIHTARHMKTCHGNVGEVLARIGGQTLSWLQKYSVPFDEIYFGKPWADIYIDDNALRFTSWDEIAPQGNNLPNSAESNEAARESEAS